MRLGNSYKSIYTDLYACSCPSSLSAVHLLYAPPQVPGSQFPSSQFPSSQFLSSQLPKLPVPSSPILSVFVTLIRTMHHAWLLPGIAIGVLGLQETR